MAARHAPLSMECLEERTVMAGFAPNPLTTIPALHSLPGARAAIYLDFDGHVENGWQNRVGGTSFNASAPAFSLDSSSDFNATEITAIRNIWERVAEDFAPFNLDVTTVDPGNYADGRGLRVVIGGNNTDWWKNGGSGISGIGSFTNPQLPNVVFVFSQTIVSWVGANLKDVDGRPMQVNPVVATTASHEAGHAFGLEHQGRYDSANNLLDEYSRGTANETPIMGDNTASDRTTWWQGMPTKYDSAGNKLSVLPAGTTVQDDMAILANATNGFGYRTDDYSGGDFATSTRLYQDGNNLFQAGILERNGDTDYFNFVTTGGTVALTMNAKDSSANLVPAMYVYGIDPGTNQTYLVGFVEGSGRLFQTIVPAGKYYVVARSQDLSYGNVGQYTISGTVPTHGIGKSLGGQVSQITVATSNDGRQELFGIDSTGAVVHKWQVSVSGAWTDWYSLGGSARQIAVAKNKNGLFEVVAIDAVGNLTVIRQSWQLDWGRAWTNLGGFYKQVAVGRNQDGRLQAFVIGGDDQVYYHGQIAADGAWSTWISRMGVPAGVGVSQITVGAKADGRLEVFALDLGGRVYHRSQVGPNLWFGAWQTDLEYFPFDTFDPQKPITVASNADGRLELFAIGRTGQAYHRWQVTVNGPWNSQWETIGGSGIQSIQVGLNGTLLQVFAVGAFNRVYTITQNSALDFGRKWADLGGWASQLIVGVNGDKRLEMFAINWDNSVWHLWQDRVYGEWV